MLTVEFEPAIRAAADPRLRPRSDLYQTETK